MLSLWSISLYISQCNFPDSQSSYTWKKYSRTFYSQVRIDKDKEDDEAERNSPNNILWYALPKLMGLYQMLSALASLI